MAFAGFSPGRGGGAAAGDEPQALGGGDRGLPPALRRGRGAHPRRRRETAERVYTMIVGFSGFGFPKAHGAAFGLLAYQSTWLRVHYGPEFLCALLNEQPMGFYASDTLVHEAQRTRDRAAAAGRQRERRRVHGGGAAGRRPPAPGAAACPAPPPRRAVGLGYVNGVRAEEVAALVAARAGGRAVPLARRSSPRAPGPGGRRCEQLAWAGACDSLAVGAGRPSRARRTALWQLGVAAPGERMPEGTQLALPLELPGAPALRPLEAWEAMVADYATTGLTLGPHPLALLRPELPAGTVSCRDLERAAARGAGADRRPGGRAPAARDGQGDRVHAARGRVRDDQPDRPADRLRAPSPDRAHRAAGARRGAAGEAAASPAGRSTSWCTAVGRWTRRPRSGAGSSTWPSARRGGRPVEGRSGGAGAGRAAAAAARWPTSAASRPPVQSFAAGRRR